LLPQIERQAVHAIGRGHDGAGAAVAHRDFLARGLAMNELLHKLLQDVDPGAPGASGRLLHNLLVLVPWWPLIWFTVGCAVVGALIGWWRGRIALGIVLGVVVGPIAWAALWALPPGRYGPARRRLQARMCKPADGEPV
jgi:hypothetical protein